MEVGAGVIAVNHLCFHGVLCRSDILVVVSLPQLWRPPAGVVVCETESTEPGGVDNVAKFHIDGTFWTLRAS